MIRNSALPFPSQYASDCRNRLLPDIGSNNRPCPIRTHPCQWVCDAEPEHFVPEDHPSEVDNDGKGEERANDCGVPSALLGDDDRGQLLARRDLGFEVLGGKIGRDTVNQACRSDVSSVTKFSGGGLSMVAGIFLVNGPTTVQISALRTSPRPLGHSWGPGRTALSAPKGDAQMKLGPRLGPVRRVVQKSLLFQRLEKVRWRRWWDSNPRLTCANAGFQDRCLKPLGHPSTLDIIVLLLLLRFAGNTRRHGIVLGVISPGWLASSRQPARRRLPACRGAVCVIAIPRCFPS